MTGAGSGEGGLVLVEGARPLSESALWRVHDTYFEESGVGAWASGAVPHAVTTGPVLARSYARMIEGFVDDCGSGRLGPVDPAQPLYVVEIGAGSGRLGFQVLSALETARLDPFRVVYLLTDRAASNVIFWWSNRRLEGLGNDGRLDFARFDPTRDRTVRLERSGTHLVPGGAANPMVVITNYLFDVLPQDLFAVHGGRLYEELVELYLDEPTVTESSSDYFDHVMLASRPRPVDGPRYGGAADELLRQSSLRAGDGNRFLFPAAGIAALACLVELAAGRVLWLIGERPPTPLRRPESGGGGGGDPAPFRPGRTLRMGVHGRSISLPPDLTVLADSVSAAPGGAELLLPVERPTGFLVAALLVGDGGEATATRSAYRFAVDELAPELVSHVVRRALVDKGEGASLGDLVSIVRTAGHDPRILEKCLPGFARRLPLGDDDLVDLAVETFRKVLKLDFPLAWGADLAGSVAALLVSAGRDEDAIWFFRQSLEWTEPDAAKLCEMARCLTRLGAAELAAETAERALALDASCEEAEAVLGELRAASVSTAD